MILFFSAIRNEDDRKQVEELYIACYKLMYGTALNILGREEEAKDAVHNTFVKVIHSLQYLTEKGQNERFNVIGYLRVMTRNTALSTLKKEHRGDEVVELLSRKEAQKLEQDAEFINELCTADVLARLIGQVDDRYQSAVIGHYGMGKTVKEIAREEGLCYDGAKSRVQRGLKQLVELAKEMLENE